MPIQLICPQCRRPFAARDESAGKRVRCPGCEAVLTVPASPGAGSGLTHTPVPPTMRAAGEREFPPPAPPEESGTIRVVEEPPPSEPPLTRLPPVPRRTPTPSAHLPGLIPDQDAAGWRRARRGLGRIQAAAVFLLIPLLVETGAFIARFIAFNVNEPLPAGFLGRVEAARKAGLGDMNLLAEIVVISFAFFGALAWLFLLFGRAACAGAPRPTFARGHAGWAAFLTLLGGAGIGLVVAAQPRFNLPITNMYWFPAAEVGMAVAVISLVVAELLMLLTYAQYGVALQEKRVSTAVGGFVFLFGFLTLVWLLADPYGMRFAETYARDYDVYLRRIMSDPLEIRDPLGRSVLTAGLCGLFTLILTLSYVGMLGKARAAIKKRLPED